MDILFTNWCMMELIRVVLAFSLVAPSIWLAKSIRHKKRWLTVVSILLFTPFIYAILVDLDDISVFIFLWILSLAGSVLCIIEGRKRKRWWQLILGVIFCLAWIFYTLLLISLGNCGKIA